MKKANTGIIISAVIFILLACCTPLIFIYKSPQEESTQKWVNEIKVTDGVVDQEGFTADFTIKEAGEYTVYFSFLPVGTDKENLENVDVKEIGFLTTVIIEDEKGDVVYTSTAGSVYLDTTMYLEAGNYTVNYYYHSDADEFRKFANKNLTCERETERIIADCGFDGFAKNVSTIFDYTLKVYPAKADQIHTAVIILWALAIGISFGCMIGFLFRKMDDPEGKQRYDERQKIEQGRGYRIGFIATMISILVSFIFQGTGILPAAYLLFLVILSAFIGLSVVIVYWIWHECYFAINENSTRFLIFIGLFGILNMVISVINILNGWMFENGVPNFRCMNLLVAVLSLEIFIALLARRTANAKLEAAEEEEEE